MASTTKADEPSSKPAYFLVKVLNEKFVIAITDPQTISDARESMVGRKQLFPTGEVALGDGGFNIGYRWHLVPESVHMTEVAMELCDGLPSHVEQNLEEWIGRRFCPWKGRVVQRLADPIQSISQEREGMRMITVTGNLKKIVAIGGETTGWAVDLDSLLEVEGEKLNRIEIDPGDRNLDGLKDRQVEVIGTLEKRYGVERKEYWCIVVNKIHEFKK